MAGKKNYELEIMISGGTDASLAASIKEAQKQIDKLAQKAKLSKADIENSFGGMSGKGIDALASISDKAFGAGKWQQQESRQPLERRPPSAWDMRAR